MDANTVIATCATAIAVLSLAVSCMEARAVRQHNRHAVRPLLELWFRRQSDGPTGIVLVNRGLGPAIVTHTTLSLDGQSFGDWDRSNVNRLRDSLPIRPHATTLRAQRAIPAGFEGFLLHLDNYDRDDHAWFSELIEQRIQLEVRYESLYGGRDLKTELHGDHLPEGS